MTSSERTAIESAASDTQQTAWRAALDGARRALHRGDSGLTLSSTFSDDIARIVEEKTRDGAREGGYVVMLQGGLARRDLVPYSDVDITFLIPKRRDRERALPIIEGNVRALWDAGLSLGHSVRSVDDIEAAIRDDVHTATSLLEARLLAGDLDRGLDVVRNLHRDVLGRRRRWLLGEKITELLVRRKRFGASAHLVEPNVKNSPGGLRDIHAILWIGLLLSPSRREEIGGGHDTLKHLLSTGLLHHDEEVAIRAVWNSVVRMRAALHLGVQRAEDRLLFEHQERMARLLDVVVDGESTTTEVLMQDALKLLIQTRNLVDAVLERILNDDADMLAPLLESAGVPKSALRRNKPRALGGGFVERRGRLTHSDPAVFQSHPSTIVDAFRLAAEERVALAPTLRQKIHQALTTNGRAALSNDVDTGAAILRLCRSTRVEGEPFTAMLDEGVASLVMGDLARLEGRFRQDGYHAYTTDAHICRCADLALNTVSGHVTPPSPLLPSLQRTSRFHLFVLGALLHDIGKGLGGDHSAVGADIARVEAVRMGLPPGEVAIIEMLVAHHLLLSKVSQRRDISDPEVVRDVALVVKTVERLDLLALVTWVDIESVAPGMFNDWKGRLLGMTVERVAQFLKDPAEGADLRGSLERDVIARAQQDLHGTVDDDVCERFLNGASTRTLAGRFADELVRDVEAFAAWERSRAGSVVITQLTEGSKAHTVRVVCDARDRLLADLAGALSSSGANILHAHADRRHDGVGLAAFRIDDGTGAALDDGSLHHLERVVRLAAEGRSARRAGSPRRRRAPYVETSVRVVEKSDSWGALTVHIAGEDRPGLIADIASTFADHGFDVVLAKITTEGERARDTFFIMPGNVGADRVDALRRALLHVVQQDGTNA